jgi:Ca2+-binding EF-hand superfamily protein
LFQNLKFSKQFFSIMDEDESGSIDIRELTYPLLVLGLANNSEFVYKAMKMLNPKKFEKFNKNQEINLKEFSKIFQIDQT